MVLMWVLASIWVSSVRLRHGCVDVGLTGQVLLVLCVNPVACLLLAHSVTAIKGLLLWCLVPSLWMVRTSCTVVLLWPMTVTC